MERLQKYDGIRPKNAVCTRCGYHIGAVPIRHGVIVCPECGEAVVFAFEPIERRTMRFTATAMVTSALLSLTLGGALWAGGVSFGASLAAALIVLVLLAPISIARVVRKLR
ncbi:MAG: hypothetical protein IIB55_07345 [Planctomycetes bacterium]|nr:hypothetical protein [Planctomycetota bacterium]